MRRLAPLALAFLTFPACTTWDPSPTGETDDDDAVSDDDTAPADGELTLVLDGSTVPAGGAVGWTLLLGTANGSSEVDADSLVSDLEPTLSWDGDSLSPTLAGLHLVTATATVDGEARTASADLEVVAGEADALEITLAETVVPIGGTTTFTLAAWDGYGNEVDTSAAVVEGDSPEVVVAGDTVGATEPGTFSVTATLGPAWDQAFFTSSPGEAATIDLILVDNDIEMGCSTSSSPTRIWASTSRSSRTSCPA